MMQPEFIERDKVIDILQSIRREWLEAADGQPLETVYGSVGLLLDDVAHGLDINIDGQSESVRVEQH
jgi:hypothetical protein